MSYWSDGPRFQPYPIPGSINKQGITQDNPDLSKKLNYINVLAYAFLQVDNHGYIYSTNSTVDLSRYDIKHFCKNNKAFCAEKRNRRGTLLGNLDAFSKINNVHNNLKKIVSIGGANSETSFLNVINHPDDFITSCCKLIKAYHLNGVDLDFELNATFTKKQANKYAKVIRKLRSKLGNKYFISIEMPGDSETLNSIGRKNWSNISKDAYVSIMGYEFHYYAYEPYVTANGSNLYSDPNEPNIKNFYHISQNQAVKYLTYLGVPANRIILGFPAYFQAYAGLHQSNNNGLYQPFNPKILPVFDYGAGRGSYRLVQKLLKQGYSQHYIYRNNEISAVYATNPRKKTWISYDNAASVAFKAKYILRNHLAGAMMWNIRQDVAANDRQSLLHSVYNEINGKTS